MCCACVTHWLGCPAMSNGNSNSQQLFFFFFFLFHSVPTHVIPTPKGIAKRRTVSSTVGGGTLRCRTTWFWRSAKLQSQREGPSFGKDKRDTLTGLGWRRRWQVGGEINDYRPRVSSSSLGSRSVTGSYHHVRPFFFIPSYFFLLFFKLRRAVFALFSFPPSFK